MTLGGALQSDWPRKSMIVEAKIVVYNSAESHIWKMRNRDYKVSHFIELVFAWF